MCNTNVIKTFINKELDLKNRYNNKDNVIIKTNNGDFPVDHTTLDLMLTENYIAITYKSTPDAKVSKQNTIPVKTAYVFYDSIIAVEEEATKEL